MNKEAAIEALMDNCIEIAIFICTKCAEETYIVGEEHIASSAAYRDGWRATEKNTYCPCCAKKYHIK
jgi:hypothetical protein